MPEFDEHCLVIATWGGAETKRVRVINALHASQVALQLLSAGYQVAFSLALVERIKDG